MKLEGVNILMIIAHFEFRDEEYEISRKIFEEEGAKVVVASSASAEAHGRLGLKVKPDLTFHQVHYNDYDCVVIVGGIGSRDLFNEGDVLTIVRDSYHGKKLLAAIGLSATVFANAGIIAGKKVTAVVSEKTILETAGAFFTGRRVEQDGDIITSNTVYATEDFAKAIVKALEWRSDRTDKDDMRKSSGSVFKKF